MRLLREAMTMPTGATPVSNHINLGAEKIVGIYMPEVGSGLTKIVLQCAVSGQENDATSPLVFVDVEHVGSDHPPAAGYVSEPVGIATAEIADGKLIMFPRSMGIGSVLPIVRLRGEGTLATNPAVFRLITDPHAA